MNRILKDRSGETMAEVLVASLVVALGVLLFAMMVQSSFHIVSDSENKMKDIYAAESNAEIKYPSSVNGSVTYQFLTSSTKGLIIDGDVSKEEYRGIKIYEDDKVETIKSYKK